MKRIRSITALTTSSVVGALVITLGGDPAPSNAKPPDPVTGQAVTDSSRLISISAPIGGGHATDPYPASVTSWGIDGPIADVDVHLDGVTLGYPDDVTMLLVAPSGTSVLLMSLSCGGASMIQSDLIIDDEAAAKMPATGACGSGSWQPSSDLWDSTALLPSPAPGPVLPYIGYRRTLSAFDGENPNGTWRLFVNDHNPRTGDGADHGVVYGGFRLTITTHSRSVVIPSSGPASTYPFVIPVANKPGRIRETYVYLRNLAHSYPDDLEILLVSPGGRKVLLMSDACGNTPIARTWRINAGTRPFPDEESCAGPLSTFGPADYQPGEDLPAPAPKGPYSTSFAPLVGTNPNGTWKVYIADDADRGSGYLQSIDLGFELAPPIDTLTPHTSLQGHPPRRTTSRKATFRFRGGGAGARFSCRIDARSWRTCSSPATYRSLKPGRHVFKVRSTDRAGNVDPTPVVWKWRIKR